MFDPSAAPRDGNGSALRVQARTRTVNTASAVTRTEHAELVALRIRQHHPLLVTLPYARVPRPQGEESGDLGLLVVGAEVEVQPVLQGLLLGHRCEQQPRKAVGGGPDLVVV